MPCVVCVISARVIQRQNQQRWPVGALEFGNYYKQRMNQTRRGICIHNWNRWSNYIITTVIDLISQTLRILRRVLTVCCNSSVCRKQTSLSHFEAPTDTAHSYSIPTQILQCLHILFPLYTHLFSMPDKIVFGNRSLFARFEIKSICLAFVYIHHQRNVYLCEYKENVCCSSNMCNIFKTSLSIRI